MFRIITLFRIAGFMLRVIGHFAVLAFKHKQGRLTAFLKLNRSKKLALVTSDQ